jgi:hypothetical protein
MPSKTGKLNGTVTTTTKFKAPMPTTHLLRARVRRWLTPALFILVTLSLTHSTTDPFMAAAVRDPAFDSLTYGIQGFFWWDETQTALQLDYVSGMNFSHVKQVFAWEDVQPIPDVWQLGQADRILEQVERRDLKLVVRLSDTPEWVKPRINPEISGDLTDAPPEDFTLFGEYCGTIASVYQGRIAAYQIWNEPNLAREWGFYPPNAWEYVELLRLCSEAIRAADPEAIIISAGLAPTGNYDHMAHPDDIFLQEMYNAGFQRYVDVVGVHAPGYTAPEISPDEAMRNGGQRFFTFRRIEDLRKIMVANGDAARQMAILEVGWTRDPINPSYSWFAVDEDTQAQYLVDAYEYAAAHWRPWVGLMSTIYMADPNWTEDDEEYWWSIVTSYGWQLTGYTWMANMPKFCGDTIIPARDATSEDAKTDDYANPCN